MALTEAEIASIKLKLRMTADAPHGEWRIPSPEVTQRAKILEEKLLKGQLRTPNTESWRALIGSAKRQDFIRAVQSLTDAILESHITDEEAVTAFSGLLGEPAPDNNPETAVAILVKQVREAPDSFVEGGKWLTTITTAITEAIKEGEQNVD